jgi:hypothetical protein
MILPMLLITLVGGSGFLDLQRRFGDGGDGLDSEVRYVLDCLLRT